MIITTHCQSCQQPVEATLPDTTTEDAAQAIASRLYCVPCAVEQAVTVTERQGCCEA